MAARKRKKLVKLLSREGIRPGSPEWAYAFVQLKEGWTLSTKQLVDSTKAQEGLDRP